MPLITFTEDVTPEGESTPHYKKGYCCDVSVRVAHEWVHKGVAKYGRIEFAKPKAEKPAAPVSADAQDDERTSKKRTTARKARF